jgi:protein transport protein SEC13
VFELGPEPGQQTLSATIGGHEGPVWEVAWAHPKFGVVLASCSYDRKVQPCARVPSSPKSSRPR